MRSPQRAGVAAVSDSNQERPAPLRVQIHADGACRGNPGAGGWGAVLASQGREKELFGGEPSTTNNRMELTAAIRALESLKRRCEVELYTDSQYVQRGISEWLPAWKRRGWRTAGGKPVKNLDLWRRLDALAAAHTVRWHWVKGHAGNAGNVRADALANRGADSVAPARAAARSAGAPER